MKFQRFINEIPGKGMLCLLVLALATCRDDSSPPTPTPVVVRTGLRGDKPKAKVQELQQITRTSYTENFKTPAFPLYETEFIQSDEYPPPVDILIVVDNSGSMSEEQQNLSTKMKALLSALQHTDWRINIITTDKPCATRPYLPLTAQMPEQEAAEKFKEAISVGTVGSASEVGIAMAMNHIALKPDRGCTPQPWLREGAKFATIILSDEDEDDGSTGTPDGMVKLLSDKGYEVGKDAKVYGIIWPPGQVCPAGFTEGAIYQDLVAKTKGLVGNICATDYSQTLADISEDVSHLLYTEIPLRGVPVRGSLIVTIDDVEYQDGWIVVGDKFILRRPLEPGSHLKITYKLDEVRSIYLANKIPIQDIAVSIDGKPIPADAYRHIETARRLDFNTGLPEDKTIMITYREKRALLTSFPFPEVPDEVIECYSNEELLAHRYLRAERRILFDPPPTDGSVIYCLYEDPSTNP